jgi:hypothetical protein
MGCLKMMFSKVKKAKNNDIISEQGETASPKDQQYSPVNTDSTPTPAILMNRLFQNQKKSISEAPETIYENEAWAPEGEFLRLFHRFRVNSK